MMQSVRIGNMKDIKHVLDKDNEKKETEQMMEQGVNLVNQKFVFENQLQSSGCFSCISPQYNIKIETSLNKVLYFPTESVEIELFVDNRQSQRRIQNIVCYLRQTVSVLKDKTDESKGSFWDKKFDLHRVVIKKAHFEEAFSNNKSTDSIKSKKRVCG